MKFYHGRIFIMMDAIFETQLRPWRVTIDSLESGTEGVVHWWCTIKSLMVEGYMHLNKVKKEAVMNPAHPHSVTCMQVTVCVLYL